MPVPFDQLGQPQLARDTVDGFQPEDVGRRQLVLGLASSDAATGAVRTRAISPSNTLRMRA